MIAVCTYSEVGFASSYYGNDVCMAMMANDITYSEVGFKSNNDVCMVCTYSEVEFASVAIMAMIFAWNNISNDGQRYHLFRGGV